MIVNNIDNLECTLSGSGTLHRVNPILLTEREPELDGKQSEEALVEPYTYTPPTKKKCKRSLPLDVVTRVLLEYYGGKRIGRGQLAYVQNLGVPNSRFEEEANDLRQRILFGLK